MQNDHERNYLIIRKLAEKFAANIANTTGSIKYEKREELNNNKKNNYENNKQIEHKVCSAKFCNQ